MWSFGTFDGHFDFFGSYFNLQFEKYGVPVVLNLSYIIKLRREWFTTTPKFIPISKKGAVHLLCLEFKVGGNHSTEVPEKAHGN